MRKYHEYKYNFNHNTGTRGILSPFGVRAAALVRDNVFKVESPKKLNFRLSHTYK